MRHSSTRGCPHTGQERRLGRLGRIMELAEAGTWEPGTKLLVEHFDRLSRDKLVDARQRAERILKAGLSDRHAG